MQNLDALRIKGIRDHAYARHIAARATETCNKSTRDGIVRGFKYDGNRCRGSLGDQSRRGPLRNDHRHATPDEVSCKRGKPVKLVIGITAVRLTERTISA